MGGWRRPVYTAPNFEGFVFEGENSHRRGKDFWNKIGEELKTGIFLERLVKEGKLGGQRHGAGLAGKEIVESGGGCMGRTLLGKKLGRAPAGDYWL